MRGRLVRLDRPHDEDYQLMEKWLASDAPVAPLTGDLGADTSAQEMKELNGKGIRIFVVRGLAEDTPVGIVNYKRESPGCFSIGGAVGDPEQWQRGYAADAFTVLIDHLFHTCNARKVQSIVMSFNRYSMRMMSRSGFVCEGVLREHCYLDGRWHDAALWSMLRHEFYAKVARDAQISERFQLQDLVSEEDKRRGRQELATHLRTAQTSINKFLESAAV